MTPFSLSLECPADIIIDCSAPLEAKINSWLMSALAIENNIDAIQVNNDFLIENLNTTCDGITEISFSASGSCPGSDEDCISTIKITDTTAPDIICPQGISIELSSEDITGEVSSFLESITVADDCHSIDLISDWDDAKVNFVCSEDIEVLFTATDDCGNFSDCTSMISFNNNVSPEIICPEEFSIYCDDRRLDNRVAEHLNRIEVASSVDYEVRNDLNLNLIDRDCEQDYFIDVEITAVDECGNEEFCIAPIHVYPPPQVYIPNIFTPESNNADDLSLIHI